MEKSEWRETFNRQPVYYLFFDFTVPLPVDNINMICQVLQNITVLSNSLKGSPRLPLLGLYVLSERTRCIFPLQSIKHNYAKLQISLESFQASQSISLRGDGPDSNSFTEILKDSVTEYEKYFRSAVEKSEEWPQIQMVFFTGQTSQEFTKVIQKALSSIHIAYINKIQAVTFRSHSSLTYANSSGSKSDANAGNSPELLYEEDEMDETISSLIYVTEIDANVYQLEGVMKQWLHDHGTDSDHLRLTVGRFTLRCDLRECLLSADILPVGGQFSLSSAGGGQQRPSLGNKQATSASLKLPVYGMEAVAVARKEGLCESMLFGTSFLAVATHCWKMDWDELDHNQQLFLAVTCHLREQGLVLVARRVPNRTPEKGLPVGLFAFFPDRNALLVKALAPSELVLPSEQTAGKDVPEEVLMEARECLEGLEQMSLYNPLSMPSGLYEYLSSAQTKRMRATTSFVAPIMASEEDRDDTKKRKRMPPLPNLKVSSSDTPYKANFMTASALLRRRFTQGFD